MRFLYRIQIYFLWKKIKKLTDGRDGKFAQARNAVKELYELSKRRSMTQDEISRFAVAVAEVARLSTL